jgi:hypothetical protein
MIPTLVLITLTLALATAAHARKRPAEHGQWNPPLTVQIAETQVATWRCQDQLGQPRTPYSRSPWNLPRSRAYRQWTLQLWQQRRTACLLALHERGRQWNWQAWLPDKWRRVGETGLNWLHANSSYVSAFGIQAGSQNGAYDNDAAKVGMPPWTDAQGRHPSPWQQYQTALSHYNQFGEFSGWGCKGA